MESIAQLREICQTTAQKDRSNVYMRYVCRSLSIYLTRLILPTKITANQISFVMILTGMTSTLWFISGSKPMFFVGAVSLQLWYLLDCMDGEVARYRYYQATKSIIKDKVQSGMTGTYYDGINHYIVNLLVPAALGMGLYFKTGGFVYVLMGLFTALGQVLMLAMNDVQARILLAHIKKYPGVQILGPALNQDQKNSKKRSWPHLVFMGIHYSMTYPTVMNLVLLAALLNLWNSFEWRVPLMIYLCLGSLLVVTTLIARTIRLELIEQHFRNQFIPFESGELSPTPPSQP